MLLLWLATKKAAQWGDLDKNMQQEMLDATRELQACTGELTDGIHMISNNPISKEAKISLLRAAKLLMQRTVTLPNSFAHLLMLFAFSSL